MCGHKYVLNSPGLCEEPSGIGACLQKSRLGTFQNGNEPAHQGAKLPTLSDPAKTEFPATPIWDFVSSILQDGGCEHLEKQVKGFIITGCTPMGDFPAKAHYDMQELPCDLRIPIQREPPCIIPTAFKIYPVK